MPHYETRYERHRLRLLSRLIPAGEGLALDVGCHDGTTTRLLAERGYTAVGIDLDADAVERGRRLRPDLDLRVGRAEEFEDLRPRSVSTCLEVLEHLSDVEQQSLLTSLARGADPGGFLVVSTPGRFSLYSIYERARMWVQGRRGYDWWDSSHVNVMSYRRLRRVVTAAGFRIDRLVGYHYLPQRLAAPVAIGRQPLARAGFDLILVCRRT